MDRWLEDALSVFAESENIFMVIIKKNCLLPILRNEKWCFSTEYEHNFVSLVQYRLLLGTYWVCGFCSAACLESLNLQNPTLAFSESARSFCKSSLLCSGSCTSLEPFKCQRSLHNQSFHPTPFRDVSGVWFLFSSVPRVPQSSKSYASLLGEY